MFFTPKHVGIDIGTNSVRIVEMKKRSSGPEIMEYIIAPLPVGAVANGNLLNVDAVSLAIQEALRKSKISIRNAVLSIDSQNVVIRHVNFPKMKEEELAEVLKWELEQYVPMPVADAVLDFVVIHEEEKDGVTMMDVMLVVAPKKVIQGYIEAVKRAGFIPLAVDIEPLSQYRVAAIKGGDGGNEELIKNLVAGAVVFMDMGAGSTKVTIFRHGKLILTRIVNIGGYDITKAVASRLRITLDQAEQVKREYGLSAIDQISAINDEVAVSKDGELEEEEIPNSGYALEIAEETKPKIDEIINEVQRSIDYYKMQHRHEFLTRIVLTGGGSLLKGLPQYLEAQLGIKCSPFNPLGFVKYRAKNRRENIDQLAPSLTNAIGLALREVRGR